MREGAVLSKDVFIAHIYSYFDEPESKIIDVFIWKFRRALRGVGLKNLKIDPI